MDPRVRVQLLAGTLTVPALDFAKMRSLCGVPLGQPILETVLQYPEPRRSQAMEYIKQVEKVCAVFYTFKLFHSLRDISAVGFIVSHSTTIPTCLLLLLLLFLLVCSVAARRFWPSCMYLCLSFHEGARPIVASRKAAFFARA